MARSKKVEKVSKAPQVPKALKKSAMWVGGGIVVLLIIANLTLWLRNYVAQELRSPIENDIAHWKEVVFETPTYRDGYLKLATLYWRLGENEKAKSSLERAREIDPNYDQTYELEEKLGY